MYGVALMHLAHLVGLRQVDIAQYFGCTTVQVNHWARGIRPIPDATVPTLVKRIAEAVERSLHAGETYGQQPTRADLTAALREVFAENCYRYGYAPAPSLEAFLEEVKRYAALSRPQQLDGPKLEHIEKYVAAMHYWFEMRYTLRPLLLLFPEEDQITPTTTEARQQEQAIH